MGRGFPPRLNEIGHWLGVTSYDIDVLSGSRWLGCDRLFPDTPFCHAGLYVETGASGRHQGSVPLGALGMMNRVSVMMKEMNGPDRERLASQQEQELKEMRRRLKIIIEQIKGQK